MTHRVMGVNGEAPACQPPTRSPSPHHVRMAVAEVQMRAAGGPCARRGMLDAGARSRHDVVGTHRSKERLSAAAQRCRAGLVVVSLKDVSHGSGKKIGNGSTVPLGARRWRTRPDAVWRHFVVTGRFLAVLMPTVGAPQGLILA